MRKFHVFINPQNGALVLISENNPDFLFYEESHEEIKAGNRRECVNYIDEYQYENFVSDEEFLFKILN